MAMDSVTISGMICLRFLISLVSLRPKISDPVAENGRSPQKSTPALLHLSQRNQSGLIGKSDILDLGRFLVSRKRRGNPIDDTRPDDTQDKSRAARVQVGSGHTVGYRAVRLFKQALKPLDR
jgi:hypothetical protein